MELTKNMLSKNRVKLSVKVPSEQMTEYFEKEYKRLAPGVSLPGFRPGKAPRVMTIEAIGHTRLSQAAVEIGLNNAYRAAIVENKVFPVNQPAISISKHPAFTNENSDNELTFEVEFDILPEVKIGDYKKFSVRKVDFEALKVADEEVEKVLKYLQNQAAKLEPLEREAERGDWAEIDFEGSHKNVVKDKLTSKNFPLVIGEANFVPGFEDKIIGMKKTETKEFALDFPKDYFDKEVAGQYVNFKVTLNELKKIELPKVDDEFSKKFGQENPAKLKESIRKSLEGEKSERERQIQVASISDQIAKIVKADIPKSLIEDEKGRLKAGLTENLKQRGMTIEKYAESMKVKMEKLENDIGEQAKRNILIGVGLGEIAKAEKIQMASPEDARKVFDRIIETNAE